MNKENLKIFAQGIAAGGVVVAIGMFWSGMAVTAGSAETMARTQAETAVVDQLAPICLAQFGLAANNQQLQKDLAAKESWNRADFVKAGGWATMPGSTTPRDDIARSCAEMIIKTGA
ncbi:hypothetical protein [Shumkonia mesophila]|uniref:hypothetical protein n=1 Tax=Shumkonia mesophila TaxID=2838854 RepID=UPI002934F8E2|nr:hypothetical protein [Shumkonia mesophila]